MSIDDTDTRICVAEQLWNFDKDYNVINYFAPILLLPDVPNIIPKFFGLNPLLLIADPQGQLNKIKKEIEAFFAALAFLFLPK